VWRNRDAQGPLAEEVLEKRRTGLVLVCKKCEAGEETHPEHAHQPHSGKSEGDPQDGLRGGESLSAMEERRKGWKGRRTWK
jgi:hypothetical protein